MGNDSLNKSIIVNRFFLHVIVCTHSELALGKCPEFHKQILRNIFAVVTIYVIVYFVDKNPQEFTV
jgi:hypothetical protein